MSFFTMKKNARRAVGTVFALFITGFMTFGFLQSYEQSKKRQVKKVDLVQVAIFADKAAAVPLLYESVRTEECIKQVGVKTSLTTASLTKSPLSITSSIATSSIATHASSESSAIGKSSALSGAVNIAKRRTKATSSAPSIKKSSLPEPLLIPATSPKCIAQSFTPVGYEKLGAEGFIGLALNLTKTGRVEHGEIEKSSGFTELDAAALKQVTDSWQFEPCKKQKNVVACKHHIRFRWEIK